MIFGPDWEVNRRRSIEQARKCPQGLSHEHLVPGAIVTHGPNKHTGDRSYTDTIWKVLATNGGHVALECMSEDVGYRKKGNRALIVMTEHEWYAAEHMLEAISAGSDEAGSEEHAN